MRIQDADQVNGGQIDDEADTTLLPQRFGEVLVARGLLTSGDLDTALTLQASARPRRRLGSILVAEQLADERAVATVLAEILGLPLVDLAREQMTPELVRLLPRAVAERGRVLVLGRDGSVLRVAAADPTNVVALDDVRMLTRASELQVVVALESQLLAQLARAWSLSGDGHSELIVRADEIEADLVDDRTLATASDDAPTVRLVDSLLGDAVRDGASDVHVEPQRDGLRIRYRIDGVLREVMSLPRSTTPSVTSRLKIVAGMDIAERRVPQDGRARITVDGVVHDARLSTLPSLHGEKVVVRLLAASGALPSLDQLGLVGDQLAAVRRALAAPQGLVLITGPTGSGKTNTLYAGIREVVTPERNVVTLEDPVEVQLPGLTQVQVNERTGMTFARGLRAVLRQDPDVVLVGEVRDVETAELALRASLTGHLVLTTLHTNDAVAALTRLVDMGAERFLVASSLSLVVAQRLVRRPCPDCAVAYRPDDDTLALLGIDARRVADANPRRGTGCPSCGGSGYRGRLGVFEVVEVTPAVRAALLSPAGEAAVVAAAQAEGVATLRRSGVDAALRGETTFEEVLRVT